jgi:hypothetical protein
MMIFVKKILLLLLVVTIPFSVVHAQKKKKKTTTHKTQTAKPKASAKKTVPKVADVENVKDTAAPKVVTVTSAFKPSLRNAAKINFTAATPVIDSTKIPLTYRVPSQNLFFSYQPVPIKPLALNIDTSIEWHNDGYIKAGFGNFSTPYLEAGIAFGDGKNSNIALHGLYTSSKGNLTFQEFSKAKVEALAAFNTSPNTEVIGKVFYNNSNQYKYGYQPSTLVFSKEQLQQQFNTIGLELGLNSKKANDYGITYHPQMSVNYFSDNRNASEIDFVFKANVNKTFGRLFAFDLNGIADITSLKTPTAPSTVKNNLFFIDPSIQFKTPNFKLNIGIRPSWDNQIFSMLPNITAEAKINEQNLVFQAGWIGYYNKNTYQSLTATNPYIEQPNQLINTKTREQYAGFKGSAGKHFTYNAKVSFLKINNLALFVNDTASSNTQTFKTLYDPELKAIRIHGEVGYTIQEKLFFTGAVTYTQFTSQSQYDKPFGFLPLEATGTVKYKLLKDLKVKGDLFVWDGTNYQSKSLQTQKLSAAVDMNIGGEFTVIPKLNIWLQFNNLFNNKYQRWNQYEVLGFNVLAGVVYSFQ